MSMQPQPALPRPPPIPSLAYAIPGKIYARHTNNVPKLTGILITNAATAAQAAKVEAATKLLKRFDVSESESDDSDSDEETSSSSSDAPTTDEEPDQERTSPTNKKQTNQPRRKRGRPKKSAASAASASTVSKSAGLAATPSMLASSSLHPITMTSGPHTPESKSHSSRSLIHEAREKIVNLLKQCIGQPSGQAVERELFLKYQGVTPAYNTHARELVSSLRVLQAASTASDADSNSTLFADIQTGRITPLEVINMTSAELAPPELKQQRQTDADTILTKEYLKPKEVEENAMTVKARKLDQAALNIYDQVINLKSKAASSSATTSVPNPSPSPPLRVAGSSDTPIVISPPQTPRALTEAENIIAKFAPAEMKAQREKQDRMKQKTAATAKSQLASDSSSDMSSDDMELVIEPKPSSPFAKTTTTAAAKESHKRKSTDTAATPSTNGNRSSPRKSDSSSTPPANKRPRTSEKQETPPERNVNGTTTDQSNGVGHAKPASSSHHPATAAPTSAPVSPLERKTSRESAATAPTVKEVKVHPEDPIQLPVRLDSIESIPAWEGQLSFSFPRRGELYFQFFPLPTRALFASTGPLSTTLTTSPLDENCWSQILFKDLNEPHKMKVGKLEYYINWKANVHLNTSAAAPSPSIQAASRMYPVSFIIKNTDPLLADLFRDMTQFYEENSLCIALDYESSRFPASRQCNVWLIPPRSLHHITHVTAKNILRWSHAPRSDEWWGIMWVKLHIYKAMKKNAEVEARKKASELDVPSDEETDAKVMKATPTPPATKPSATVAATIAHPVTAPVATPVNDHAFQFIKTAPTAATADYLTNLISKVASTAPTVTVAPPQPIPIQVSQPPPHPHPSTNVPMVGSMVPPSVMMPPQPQPSSGWISTEFPPTNIAPALPQLNGPSMQYSDSHARWTTTHPHPPQW